jgi:hypothetical protein
MKPAAYITETEEGDMVWLPEDYIEACTYFLSRYTNHKHA